jgi:hypothetical protein
MQLNRGRPYAPFVLLFICSFGCAELINFLCSFGCAELAELGIVNNLKLSLLGSFAPPKEMNQRKGGRK